MNEAMNHQLVDRWVQAEISNCPQFILDKIGADQVREQIQQEVALNLSYCTDESFARSNFYFCQLAGTAVEDFKYRQIDTPFGEIITSIRFIGGDLSKPAVFLIYKDFDLNLIDDINQIGQIISDAYAVFKPQRMRWFSPGVETALIESNASISGDLIYVTAFIDDLKQQPLPRFFDKVQLKVATAMDWYETYQAAYETIYEAWPEFVEMAVMESQETLQALIQKKLLFEIHIEQAWAGIIAVDQASDKFFTGYVVYEELLTKKFRGKKLAPAVQRHLIEKLPATQRAMLFGTIHYGNQPSLKTAFNVGRRPAGMYVFADI